MISHLRWLGCEIMSRVHSDNHTSGVIWEKWHAITVMSCLIVCKDVVG